MAIIVLEGPDESGKTWLAKRLVEILNHDFSAEYQRSPIKQYGWSHEYNHYLNNLCRANPADNIVVQDRIPEISESIYGALRGNVRCAGWLNEAGEWFYSNIFMVFCEGPGVLKEHHYDVEDLPVAHPEIMLLYDYTYFQLNGFVRGLNTDNFVLRKYNRFSPDQSDFHWELILWLSHLFPNKRKSLKYALDQMERL